MSETRYRIARIRSPLRPEQRFPNPFVVLSDHGLIASLFAEYVCRLWPSFSSWERSGECF
uniref:Uncharacterized protein n=1 Tax=Setaria italica TaxID=4555 RepID=K3YKQ1_SETIT